MKDKRLFQVYKYFIYVSVFCIYYILFLNQGLNRHGPLGWYLSDVGSHTLGDVRIMGVDVINAVRYLHQNWFTLFTKDFEPFLHILVACVSQIIHLITQNNESMDLINAMAFVLSTAKLCQFILVKKIVEYFVNLRESESIFVTIIVNFCNTLYLPIISLHVDYPILTPNNMHSPTMILLAPVAMLFFYQYIKYYICSESTPTLKISFLLSLLLLIATFIKPAFTNIMFILLAIYYVIHLKRFLSKRFIHDLIIFIPSAIIVIYQIYLVSKAEYGHLEFAPYKVIGYLTQHPFIALFAAIEFPLLITVISLLKKHRKYSTYLGLAWLFTLIAYLIFALFSLAGSTWFMANLQWSYEMGLTLLYLFSIIAWADMMGDSRLEKEIAVRCDQLTHCLGMHGANHQKIASLLYNVSSINLGLLFASGIHKFMTIYLGGTPWI